MADRREPNIMDPMTALDQYQRLECTALWRDCPDDQLREVIVALGEASLVITDLASRPLSHWSLPAIQRLNPGETPALYRPGGDAQEELEVDDPAMIDGIEMVRSVIERRRAHPGRLRTGILLAVFAVILSVAVFWLPGAMIRYTASVVPDAKRAAIGAAVLDHVHRVTGGECRADRVSAALGGLWTRLALPADGRIAVLADGAPMTAHLPGRIILVNRSLVEDFDTPEVLAGYVVAEGQRARSNDPLIALLNHAGLRATFRLLTTGDLPPESLSNFGEHIMTNQPKVLPTQTLLAAFARAKVPAGPYAYALDLTGEETVDLIEADPFAGGGAPALMRDAEWVLLQGICGG